jgi:hypothetical protein
MRNFKNSRRRFVRWLIAGGSKGRWALGLQLLNGFQIPSTSVSSTRKWYCRPELLRDYLRLGRFEANLQNAVTYDSRGLAKEEKGDSVEKNAPNNLESYS